MNINSRGKTLSSAAVVAFGALAVGALAFATKKKPQKTADETPPELPTAPPRTGNNGSASGTDSTSMNS